MFLKKLLITDLDDTLYGWLEFFIPAFLAMVDKIVEITGISKDILMKEYKQKHQFYGSVEHPYVSLELPSILELYKGKDKEYIYNKLGEAFHSFNSVRKRKLILFPNVENTLKKLNENNVIVIGYTESSQENGYYRLKKLGIEQYFKYVYSANSMFSSEYEKDKIRIVSTKKPNPQALLDICETMNVRREEAIYVGDSLTKDMYMAIMAGITSVWVNYDKEKNDYYKTLVDITSWTDDDFRREQELKKIWSEKKYSPDFEIKKFEDLLNIVK